MLALLEFPLFVNPGQRMALMQSPAEPLDYQAGETVIRKGDAAEYLCATYGCTCRIAQLRRNQAS